MRGQKSWSVSITVPISHWLRAVEGGKGHKFLSPSGSPVPSNNMLAFGEWTRTGIQLVCTERVKRSQVTWTEQGQHLLQTSNECWTVMFPILVLCFDLFLFFLICWSWILISVQPLTSCYLACLWLFFIPKIGIIVSALFLVLKIRIDIDIASKSEVLNL